MSATSGFIIMSALANADKAETTWLLKIRGVKIRSLTPGGTSPPGIGMTGPAP